MIRKNIAIIAVFAIVATITSVGIAEAIVPLSIESNHPTIISTFNELLNDHNARVTALENSINSIHTHTYTRGDYILGETITLEQNIAFCDTGEIATGGGFFVVDPGLRVVSSKINGDHNIVTISGNVTLSGANMAAYVKCITPP